MLLLDKSLKIVKQHLSNLPGWRTNRKIVVFESDDWGTIRMPSKEAFNKLSQAGIPVGQSRYNTFDSLECNDDLVNLYEVLSSYTDKNGVTPVFTGLCVVANPDFEKISDANFENYYYEPFTKTLERLPGRDRVHQLWIEGAYNKLFVPQFHGREHLNVHHWLQDLKAGNPHSLMAFENRLWGIASPLIHHDYQAAFNILSPDELQFQHEILENGIDLFAQLVGYKPSYFVPTNGAFNLSLESTLHNRGIQYLTLDKRQKEPLGNGKHKVHYRYLGKKNKFGQMYLTRNAAFEPSAGGIDWVFSCLRDIEIAFRMRKPAVISTHRVNYIGVLEVKNRDKGLRQLSILIKQILKKWPETEFLTSIELGKIIRDERIINRS